MLSDGFDVVNIFLWGDIIMYMICSFKHVSNLCAHWAWTQPLGVRWSWPRRAWLLRSLRWCSVATSCSCASICWKKAVWRGGKMRNSGRGGRGARGARDVGVKAWNSALVFCGVGKWHLKLFQLGGKVWPDGGLKIQLQTEFFLVSVESCIVSTSSSSCCNVC